MRGRRIRASEGATQLLAPRRALVAAARRVLWDLACERTRRWRIGRGVLRRRLGKFLARSGAGRLRAILRSAALAGAVAAALFEPSPAQAQAIELSDVASGSGGFIVRAEGEPASGLGRSVAGVGDVNGDGMPDYILDSANDSVYVIFGKAGSEPLEVSDLKVGRGGFAIRGRERAILSGSSVAGAGDVNGDGLADLLIGAPSADPGGRILAGESYVVFGKAGGEAVELADVQAGRGGFVIHGSGEEDRSGSSVAGAGDVNGDGLADLLIGAPNADPGGRLRAGESYIVFGKTGGEAVELVNVQAGRGGFVIHGSGEEDRSGSSVAGAGDVNGDGLTDLLIGAPSADPGGRILAGESYVVFGKAGGEAVELAEVQAGRGGFVLRGGAEDDSSGSSVAGAGDVNGDGLADLLIGAPDASAGGHEYAGKSYVVFGKAGGEVVELADLQVGRGGFVIHGSGEEDRSGARVAGAGDVNGDGLADLLIGAPSADLDGRIWAGESYVVFGKPGGEAIDLVVVQAGQHGFVIRGSTTGDRSGSSVAGAGDVNGDGLADLLIGAPGADPGGRVDAGGSYVVFGKPGGEAVELRNIEAGQGGFVTRGSAALDYSLSNVAAAGDMNGDGLADLLIGAPRASPGGRLGAGESYVVFGKPGGEAVEIAEVKGGRGGFAIRGSAEDDLSGRVAGAGDVNGDGLPDLLIGAPRASPGGRFRAGESYVVFGKAGGEAVELSEVQAGQGGFAIRGQAAYNFAAGVAGAGDVNGDGLADLLIGAPQRGESYVVFGKPGGEAVELAEVQAGQGGFVIRGGARASGFSVAGAGDVNGDGLADLLIGAPFADPGGRISAGESYVVFGKAGGEAVDLADVQAGQGGFAIGGRAEDDHLGLRVAGAGDVNGDGLADLLLGADWAGHVAGASYVVFGKPGGDAVDLAQVETGRGGFAIRGSGPGNYSVFISVAGAGDVNGDGLADLLIGADWADPDRRRWAGESYVVFGKPGGEAVELAEVQAGRGGFAIRGSAAGDRSGSSVVGAGDVDGDGLADDLLISSGLGDVQYPAVSGAAYVVFGPRQGPRPQLFRRGAVRGEAALNLSDAIRLLGHLFLGDPAPPCLDAADADDSGTLELTDAVRVLGYLFLGGEAPPEPGPVACGEDPTADELGCVAPTEGCAR